MVKILSSNDVILNLIDLLRLSQPNATTNPGSVIRDICIDAPATQIGLLYDTVSQVSSQQSLRLVVGSDLDKLAKNYGLTRKQAVASSGIGLLTFNTLQGTININSGGIVTASNGFSFQILNGLSITSGQANFYRSVATKNAAALQFLGITDQYAAEITVQATTVGTAGNIPQYALISTTIPGVSHVTNTQAFTGGSNQEDDATFRNRILAVFSGSAVGTVLGYRNTALATSGVTDAYIAGPGDPLMTRDGTVTTTDSQGNITIVSEGTGGKVDISILGSSLTQHTDSFIYQDKSNKNDPTNAANNFVLGQIASDANKSFNQKRISDIAAGTLPAQPVSNIIQVTGSISGSNFTAKSVDANGVVSGNYELLKDTSVYAGSPWGFDTFHWISNQISDFSEDEIKGQFNGQDPTTYSGVLEIPQAIQNVPITNENSTVVSSNNSLIQLLHTPAANVTRVFNVNTGETYTVINQNFSGTGTLNTSGVIQISGNTLPTANQVLQVDYSWVITYDQYMDYDGKKYTNNPRPVGDSIDWGFSNLVRDEQVMVTLNGTSTFYTGTTTLPITSVISATLSSRATGVVSQVTSGIFAGRLAVLLSNLPVATTSLQHVYFQHTNNELYNTAQGDGSFSNATMVVGINIEYLTTIILPTDTKAQIGDGVLVIMNASDMFNVTNSNGSFINNELTLPAVNFPSGSASVLTLDVGYIANVENFLTTGITSLPDSRLGNGYALNSSVGFNNVNPANTARREFQLVQLNLSNQFFVELDAISTDTSLVATQIVSVVRLSDGLELWNNDQPGTIAIDSGNSHYQLVFNGFNTPAMGDSVLVVYYADDIARFQPFSFSNQIIERDFGILNFDIASGNFIVNMHTFSAATGLTFEVLQPGTNTVLATAHDGYILPNSPAGTAIFGSSSVHFGGLTYPSTQSINILSQQLRILHATDPNNNNAYDISAFNNVTGELTIGNNFNHINGRQISIIRLKDGQDLWSDKGTIDLVNNRLLFPQTTNASAGDKVLVLFYRFNNLKQASTRLAVTVTDQAVNTGTLSFNGITLTKATNILFTATSSGLTQNLIVAFRSATGLSSNAQLPTNVKLAKIVKLEKVVSTAPGGGEVLEVLATLDLPGTSIQDNTFFADAFFSNLSLGNFDFVLPTTANNTQNAPAIGDTLRVTFYYTTTNDLENINFTRNGTLYSNKSFALLNKLYVSSGFNVSKSATLALANFNQPITGSRYTSIYNYTAPQPNERIIITYNYNQLISNVTFAVENARPVDADVLVKGSAQVLVDCTMDVVITAAQINNTALIVQNVTNALVSAINATSLGTSLDGSVLVNTAFSVSGVAASRIITFNVDGHAGQVATIKAQNNQYLVANNIIVTPVAT